MSGVEDIQKDPPDPDIKEGDDGTDPDKDEITQPVGPALVTSDSSDASSLTSSWTLLEKEEEDGKKKPDSDSGSASGSSIEVLNQNDIRDKPEETDSDSIVTISDDEILVAQSHAYCYIPAHVDGGTQESLTSTISTVSVASDGIPIKSQDDEEEEAGAQYDWNSEGEREIPEDRVEEIQQPEDQEAANLSEPDDDDEQESEAGGHLEPGEPGYDLDDDGLPGAPLPPLPQEVELYPSQELDPSYQAIKKEKIYKHDKNLQVDHFLTAILVLALALVIGLGIGHFLGLFLSVTTNIDSSLFGLNPDPFEQKFGGTPSSDFDLPRDSNPVAESSSYFVTLKNAIVRLGVKFGYYKKPQPHPDVLHDFHDGEEYYEFTCMTADDQPILVNNQPVTVSQPEDCSKYFPVGESAGHASSLQPPPYFTEVAKDIFKRLSERLEVQEMFENLQEERLDNLQEDLVSCIEGDEGQGGDDQDLDDRVIKKLWEENQELRDQVHQLKSDNPNSDEAMTAILRDKINELLTANADLEREVARLRYADAARGAAESVETLDKLRKTRDTLNDIVTENDQLKIEVGKARYGEPFADTKNIKEERDLLAVENQNLKEKIKVLLKKEQSYSPSLLSKIDHAFQFLQEGSFFEPLIEPLITNFNLDEFNSPWPSKRNEELNKNSEGHGNSNSKDSNRNFQSYLTELLKMFSKDGTIDIKQSEVLVDGLKATLVANFQDRIMSKKDLADVLLKFDELKKFVNGNLLSSNMKSLKIASLKFLKSLLGAVKDIKEANEENSGKSWFKNKFAEELSEVKEELNNKWNQIFKKWKSVTSGDYSRDRDDDEDDDDDDEDDDDDDDDDDDKKNKKEYTRKKDQRKKEQSKKDDDEGYHSKDEDNYYQKDKRHNERKHGKRNYEKRNSTSSAWDQKRSIEREKQRKEKDRSDWIFERAKQRKDSRYEETRGDWYTERTHWRENDKESKRDKGEKYNYESADKYSKKQSKKLKGETKRFKEKVSYAERHLRESDRKKW